MRVLVTGGRGYDNKRRLDRVLDLIGPSEIAEGGAFGADSLSRMWAHERGVPCRTYRADWKKYGRGAGPIRNRFMHADFKPQAVVAFEGGAGTADMIKVARAAGTPVFVIQEFRMHTRLP